MYRKNLLPTYASPTVTQDPEDSRRLRWKFPTTRPYGKVRGLPPLAHIICSRVVRLAALVIFFVFVYCFILKVQRTLSHFHIFTDRFRSGLYDEIYPPSNLPIPRKIWQLRLTEGKLDAPTMSIDEGITLEHQRSAPVSSVPEELDDNKATGGPSLVESESQNKDIPEIPTLDGLAAQRDSTPKSSTPKPPIGTNQLPSDTSSRNVNKHTAKNKPKGKLKGMASGIAKGRTRPVEKVEDDVHENPVLTKGDIEKGIPHKDQITEAEDEVEDEQVGYTEVTTKDDLSPAEQDPAPKKRPRPNMQHTSIEDDEPKPRVGSKGKPHKVVETNESPYNETESQFEESKTKTLGRGKKIKGGPNRYSTLPEDLYENKGRAPRKPSRPLRIYQDEDEDTNAADTVDLPTNMNNPDEEESELGEQEAEEGDEYVEDKSVQRKTTKKFEADTEDKLENDEAGEDPMEDDVEPYPYAPPEDMLPTVEKDVQTPLKVKASHEDIKEEPTDADISTNPRPRQKPGRPKPLLSKRGLESPPSNVIPPPPPPLSPPALPLPSLIASHSLHKAISSNPDFSHTLLSSSGAHAFAQYHLSRTNPHLLPIYIGLQSPFLKASITRYLILAAAGGYWVDLDTVTSRSFEELVPHEMRGSVKCIVGVEYDQGSDLTLWPGNEKRVQFAQWTLASSPGHPLVERMVVAALEGVQRLADYKKQGVWELDINAEEMSSLIGPGVWGGEVLRALGEGLGYDVRYEELSGLKEPRRFGDVLVLPWEVLGGWQAWGKGSAKGDSIKGVVRRYWEGAKY